MHAWYRRGMDLLGRGSPAAAAQVLQRASTAEPGSRSVREALARAQFDAGRYAEAADNFRMIVEASPSDDYANFGLGLALARTGNHAAAAEYLALAAAMRPDATHYTEALRSVRATLRARKTGPGAVPNDRGPGCPRGSEEPLDTAYDVALLDLDGVVYLGGAAIPGAAEALRKADAAGMRLAYVTNNAFRTPAAIAALLTSFGVPAAAEDVVTSAQAAARLLAERLPAGAPVLVIGGSGLRMALRERGLRPVSTADDKPRAVVQGYAPDVSYSMLAEGGLAVAAGALFVASNGDLTLPSRRGRQPGNGSLIQVVATATGVQPLVAGKPEPPLHRESVLRTGARHPLVVGDRLDTDIEGAHRVGADSMLVLTGVTGPAEAVLAPPSQRPTYLAEDLAGLLEPHPGDHGSRRRVRLRRLDGAPGRGPAGTGRRGRAHRRPARTVRRRLGPASARRQRQRRRVRAARSSASAVTARPN